MTDIDIDEALDALDREIGLGYVARVVSEDDGLPLPAEPLVPIPPPMHASCYDQEAADARFMLRHRWRLQEPRP